MEEIIELIGKDKYVELLKKYNLCTKNGLMVELKDFI